MNEHTDPSLIVTGAEAVASPLSAVPPRETHFSLPETHAAIEAFAREPVAAGHAESGLRVLRRLAFAPDAAPLGTRLSDETKALIDTMDKAVAGRFLDRHDLPRLRGADTLIRRWQDETARRPAASAEIGQELKRVALAVGRVVSVLGHEEMTIGTRYR